MHAQKHRYSNQQTRPTPRPSTLDTIIYFFFQISIVTQILTTQDYPWLHCNNTWNTKFCRPLLEVDAEAIKQFLLETRHDLRLLSRDDRDDVPEEEIERIIKENRYSIPDSMGEYVGSHLSSMDFSKVVAVLATWLFTLLPLVFGPKSLLWSFYVAVPLALLLQVLLFFRAVIHPEVGQGIQLLLHPSFSAMRGTRPWEQIFYAVFGFWSAASMGSLFTFGKYANDKIFSFPIVIVGVVGFLVINLVNLFKVGGFIAHFTSFFGVDQNKFFDTWFPFYSIPLTLSYLPGSNFWLLVHVLYNLCLFIPYLSFVFETIASSIAELFPAASPRSDRVKFPQNLLLTGILAAVGIVISLILLYVNSLGVYFFGEFYRHLNLSYLFAFMFVIYAIVPISLMKKTFKRHEDLLSFVTRQAPCCVCCPATVVKGLTIFFLVMCGLQGLKAPVGVAINLWEVYNILPSAYCPVYLNVGSLVVFFICLLIVVAFVLVQVFRHFKGGRESHPFCVSLGQPLNPELTATMLGDKMEMDPTSAS